MDEATFKERLNKTSLKQENEVTINVTQNTNDSTPILIVPECDFPEYQPQLNELVNKYPEIFSKSRSDVGKSTGNKVTIRLTTDAAVNVRNYRTPMKLRPILSNLITELVDAKVIEECESNEYNSPVLLVPKKSDGTIGAKTHRMVIDYRALNKIIETVVYPMPRIKDILSEYKGCKIFSYVDICHAFYTIQLDPASRKYTAFSCELGKFQFRFLPQGLKIAPAVFQGQISQQLSGLKRTNPYMDDIISGEATCEQEFESLEELFKRLSKYGYKLALPKCKFLVKKASFAGFDITKDGIAVPDDRINAARLLKEPKTMSEVKSVMGFFSFLRDYVPYYCDMLGPIQDLLSINASSKN